MIFGYLNITLPWNTKVIIHFFIICNYSYSYSYSLLLGEHHYFDIPDAYGPSSTSMIFNERDEKKRLLCASKGIKLVCIPYWYALDIYWNTII